MLDGMSDSIQGSRIENLHSREVDRQSPTGLIFQFYNGWATASCILRNDADIKEKHVFRTNILMQVFGNCSVSVKIMSV